MILTTEVAGTSDIAAAFVTGARSGMSQALRDAIVEVEVRSTVLPTIKIDLKKQSASAGSKPGGGVGLLRVVKPAVELRTTAGSLKLAPRGEPATPGIYFPVVLGTLAALVTLGALNVTTALRNPGKTAGMLGASAAVGAVVWWWQRGRV